MSNFVPTLRNLFGFKKKIKVKGGQDLPHMKNFTCIPAKVEFHEMAQEDVLQTFLYSLGDPNKLRFTRKQIAKFCSSHYKWLWQQERCVFLFVFEENGESFVVYVFERYGELYSGVSGINHLPCLENKGLRRLVVVKDNFWSKLFGH